MDFNAYQALAERTMNPSLDRQQRLANTALGLAGEAGETADLIKKHLFHGHPLDEAKLKAELGDILWYLATMANTLGVSLEEVADGNIAKLKARYPEGFDRVRSLDRGDEGA